VQNTRLIRLALPFAIVTCLCFASCGTKNLNVAESVPESDRQPSAKGTLYVLLAASENFKNSTLNRKFTREKYAEESVPAIQPSKAASGIAGADSLSEFFLQQEAGNLYSQVVIRKLYNANFTKAEFFRTLSELETEVADNDAFILYICTYSGIDRGGNLFFIPFDGRHLRVTRNIRAGDIAAQLAAFKTRKTAVLANANRSGLGVKLTRAVKKFSESLDGLPLFMSQNNVSSALIDAFENADDGRYLSVGHFTQGSYFAPGSLETRSPQAEQGLLNAQGYVRVFPLLDRWLEPGLLQVSALFPGTVTVTGSGIEEIFALDSLESFDLKLPEGNYSVSITYRNSFQESRQAELANNGSAAVSFNYRPSLNARSFSGALPSFGVNIAELNPSGYRRIDQNVLSSMGMEQHRISFLAGEKFYQAGDYDKAIAEFNRAISLKGDYADAYCGRGNAYRKKGDAARAIDNYSTAIKYSGNRAELYNYRGYAYSERGEADKAIADFSQAIRIKRDYADAFINRGHAHFEKSSFDLAMDDYSQAIRLEPGNATAWNRRGNAWYRKGDEQRALADFSQAIKINPGYALAWLNRGNLRFNMGEYSQALADLNQAIKLAPTPAAYLSRGSVYQKLGDDALAQADYAAAERQ
jgi:tetratricopeptide (TPR) repeat protein